MNVKRKLKAILLVDDHESINYFHNLIIKKAEIAETTYVAYNGREALDILKQINIEVQGNIRVIPELILLDINMPKVNGWDFLEEYKTLKKELKDQISIVMLTTSFNPDDEIRARSMIEVADYKSKPLTDEMLQDIIKKHFPMYIE